MFRARSEYKFIINTRSSPNTSRLTKNGFYSSPMREERHRLDRVVRQHGTGLPRKEECTSILHAPAESEDVFGLRASKRKAIRLYSLVRSFFRVRLCNAEVTLCNMFSIDFISTIFFQSVWVGCFTLSPNNESVIASISS